MTPYEQLMMRTTRDYLVYWEDPRGMLHPQLCKNCLDAKHARLLAMREYMPNESIIRYVIDVKTVEVA